MNAKRRFLKRLAKQMRHGWRIETTPAGPVLAPPRKSVIRERGRRGVPLPLGTVAALVRRHGWWWTLRR